MSGKGRLLLTISLLSFLALGGLFFALRVWMPFMWGVLAPAIIGLAGWLFTDRVLLVDFFTMKTTKQGLNMGALILIVVLFLAAVNYLGARHYTTFDFSNNQVNSISEQSKKVISSLESNLAVKFFYKTGAERVEENKKIFRELVKHYQDISEKIQFEVVEINERPRLAQDYGASKGTGEAFIEYRGNKNRVENYTEQDFTNAIIKATRKEKKNIYFLEGHNERSTDDEKSETSLFGFRQLLEKNSYVVKKFNLVETALVPAEAHAVVIAGPTQQFQANEVKAIEQYLTEGGQLMLLLDERDMYGLGPLLSRLGVELERHYVYNVFNSPMGQVVNAQAATVAVGYSANNDITRLFTANQMTVFRNPHSLKLTEPSELLQHEVLVKTPESSVALAELDSQDYLGQPRAFNLAVQVKGKLNEKAKEFTALIFSDADFISNILLYQNINRDLALNSVAALAKETDLIAVSPKEPAATKLLVSPPEFNQFFRFVVVGIFLPLPFVFMILSIVLWYRRRHA
jgi:ABC-type uncharacterized transport system involved in gliding motility auxiliary subunit